MRHARKCDHRVHLEMNQTELPYQVKVLGIIAANYRTASHSPRGHQEDQTPSQRISILSQPR